MLLYYPLILPSFSVFLKGFNLKCLDFDDALNFESFSLLINRLGHSSLSLSLSLSLLASQLSFRFSKSADRVGLAVVEE